MKIFHWGIALCGLWEFGDIAALFVPDFGNIQAFVWNHILVGMILIFTGTWAALTSNMGAAKTMSWIAAVAGLWLMIAPFVLGVPVVAAGLWNDIIVGGIALILGAWAALALRRVSVQPPKVR